MPCFKFPQILLPASPHKCNEHFNEAILFAAPVNKEVQYLLMMYGHIDILNYNSNITYMPIYSDIYHCIINRTTPWQMILAQRIT